MDVNWRCLPKEWYYKDLIIPMGNSRMGNHTVQPKLTLTHLIWNC